jgi:hypothetical protein
MLIIRTNKISNIQKEFNDYFPYLKLEFFKRLHKVHAGSPSQSIIKEDMLLKPVRDSKSEIFLNEHMPVTALEQLFLDQFGIFAQVFRKPGNMWLETSRTDDWTLKRQNDEGMELSRFQSS